MGIQGNKVVGGLAKAAFGHSEVNFKVVEALVAVAEKVMLEKWQLRWNHDVNGQLCYAIEPAVSFQVKYADKKQRKQTAILTLRLVNVCLMMFWACLEGMSQGTWFLWGQGRC